MFKIKLINLDTDLELVLDLIIKHLDNRFNSQFFIWKHLENPFGKSLAIGAWDNNHLIGLRIFMRWEFIGEDSKIIKAIRPVDTVTHQNYRGKGVFKSLTLKGLRLIESEYDLVFNTPNQKSLPGYLQMGWTKIEIKDFFVYGIKLPSFKKQKIRSVSEYSELIPKLIKGYRTNITQEFLKWRYPQSEYKIVTYSYDDFLIYKKMKIKGVSCLFIYEAIGNESIISKLLSELATLEKCFLFYGFFYCKKKSPDFFLTIKRKSPIVLYKNDIKNIHPFIHFSLGDLEGKL